MKISIPERKKLVYECRIPMRWGDMDALNHLNNAKYFQFLEIGRVDWLRSLGSKADGGGEGPVVVNAFCNFYQQLQYPGDVLLKLYVSDPARATFESWASMARADAPERICAEGGATIMWVDYAMSKSAALPDWLRRVVGD